MIMFTTNTVHINGSVILDSESTWTYDQTKKVHLALITNLYSLKMFATVLQN